MNNSTLNASSKPCILILGMHRSGTSCLAGSLQQQGVYLGDVHKWNPHNLKGNRENPKIMELNESVFAFNHSTWDRPTDHPVIWTEQQQKQRDRLIQDLEQNAQQAWGFKDPRTLINLDFWLKGLVNTCTVKCVGTFRHPLAVVQSLHKRNGTPLKDGLALWYSYNSRLLAYWEKARFPLLSFDVAAPVYSQNFQQVCAELGLNFVPTEQPFFENQLRSSAEQPVAAFQDLAEPYASCYQRLQATYLAWAA
jgi:hypothetical protein